jgi:hypothetical protein
MNFSRLLESAQLKVAFCIPAEISLNYREGAISPAMWSLNIISDILQVYLLIWRRKVCYLLIGWLFERLGMFYNRDFRKIDITLIVMKLHYTVLNFMVFCSSLLLVLHLHVNISIYHMCRINFSQGHQNHACLLLVVLMLPPLVW